MLFDLRGRRRRAVQATYLTLAVLMGGGLVLFGIGGDVSGGLIDAFGGRDSSGDDANSQLERESIARRSACKRLAGECRILGWAGAVRTIRRPRARSSRARPHSPTRPRTTCGGTGVYWERYVEATDNDPEPSLARLALQAYAPEGLNQPGKAKEAVRIIAADSNDTQTYLLLVQYATRPATAAGRSGRAEGG